MLNRRRGRLLVVAFGVAAIVVVANASAQEEAPTFWGLGTSFHFVGAEEFQSGRPHDSFWEPRGHGFWGFKDGGTSCYAAVRIPTGSLITGMTVIYEDSRDTPGFRVAVKLDVNWVAADGSAGATELAAFESTGAPGVAAYWVDVVPDHTVLYIDGTTAQSYTLEAFMPPTADLALRGVIIGWNRQISPAPAAATFADVPVGAFGFQHIEALAASEITAGCGSGNFCPDKTLTRAEMAVFLAKALGLHWAP